MIAPTKTDPATPLRTYYEEQYRPAELADAELMIKD